MFTEPGNEAAEQRDGSAGQQVSGESETRFDTERANAALTGSLFHGKLHHFTTIESTQTQAVAAAQAGAAAGQVYVADEQTAGRGRGGHTWRSDRGSGLYVTVLLRPKLRAEHALSVSFAAGLAARSAVLEVTGAEIDLRWPNDLVTMGPGSRKLGGILTESSMHPDGSLRYAAVGMGLNLNQRNMPQELANEAASLWTLTGAETRREDLLTVLLRHLEMLVQLAEERPAMVRAMFAQSSTWVHGKRVSVAEDEGYTGVTDGLTAAGLLRVRDDRGQVRVVRHGGVRELL